MNDAGGPTASASHLLRSVSEFIRRFVVITDEETALLAAWVLHTYTLAAAQVTPYVMVVSATKGCGKSTLLAVLREIVRNPLVSASITPAVSYRVIVEGNEPTMLLDEQDQRRGMNDDLRAIINAGFERKALVHRMENGEVKGFPVFCAKALAGIGQLDSTIVDRGFQVNMRKSLPTEAVDRFRVNDREIGEVTHELRQALEAWADPAVSRLAIKNPTLPEELDGRGCDIFEQLFCIADDAGEEWAERVRAAAIGNRKTTYVNRLDPGTELLRDLRDLWGRHTEGFVASRDIIAGLLLNAELRWSTYGHGNTNLNERGFAMLVKRFDIESIRDIDRNPNSNFGNRQARGYRREQFQEVFDRFLGPLPAADADETDASDKSLAQKLEEISPFLRGRPEANDEPAIIEPRPKPRVKKVGTASPVAPIAGE